MIVIGLTGGIASGKTTITNFLKKKEFAVHDSDSVVKNIYSKPGPKFLSYLKKTNLKSSIKGNKIDKKTIREEIFTNTEKRKLLEKYLHAKVKKSRDIFLKKNRQKKTQIVFLDIPLLFENKLEKICNYTILFYAPLKIRKQRAIRRKGMQKRILVKIIKSQLSDKIKKKKADFIINTSASKDWCFNKILKTIEQIKDK
jgi:dephospho-CoA kinase